MEIKPEVEKDYLVKGSRWACMTYRSWNDGKIFMFDNGISYLRPDQISEIIPLEDAIRAVELKAENKRLRDALERKRMCVCGHIESQHSFFEDHDECDYCQCETGFSIKEKP